MKNMGDKAEKKDMEMVINDSEDGDETRRKLTVVTTSEEVVVENTVLLLDDRKREVLLNKLKEEYSMEVDDGDLMLRKEISSEKGEGVPVQSAAEAPGAAAGEAVEAPEAAVLLQGGLVRGVQCTLCCRAARQVQGKG